MGTKSSKQPFRGAIHVCVTTLNDHILCPIGRFPFTIVFPETVCTAKAVHFGANTLETISTLCFLHHLAIKHLWYSHGFLSMGEILAQQWWTLWVNLFIICATRNNFWYCTLYFCDAKLRSSVFPGLNSLILRCPWKGYGWKAWFPSPWYHGGERKEGKLLGLCPWMGQVRPWHIHPPSLPPSISSFLLSFLDTLR